MTYAEEAIGVARAAARAGLPVVISFTVETDGRLPSGQTLAEAIAQVDAETGGAPAYYMINCAHPTHFEDVLDGRDVARAHPRAARQRLHAAAMPSSTRPTELDDGDPADLGARYAALRAAAAPQRGRRLLRHRPPPRGGDRGCHRGLAAAGPAGPEAVLRALRLAAVGCPRSAGGGSGRKTGSGSAVAVAVVARRCQLSSSTKMMPPATAARMIEAATVMTLQE